MHPLLPSGRPDYTRVVPCRCKATESEEERISRLRRDTGALQLKLLRDMTFRNFDHKRVNLTRRERESLERAYRTAREFAENPEGWIVLQGVNGCGKTHLAAAIGNYQLHKGNLVFFQIVPDLLDHLRATFAPSSDIRYDDLFERIRSAPLLILDDFGEQASTPWAQEKLYQVINYRYNERLPTVITTCLPLEDMETRMSSRLADVSLSSNVNIDVPDYRSDVTHASSANRKSPTRGGSRRSW
ncbi:MAG: ATP-binding protein [Chloroflexota bacterium]